VNAHRPKGVTAITVLFLLAAAYLVGAGLLMLASPGLIPMAAGADLLAGLEVAGPYMFLLMAAVGTAIALGLLHLHNWARRVAVVIAMIGVVLLLPRVSSAIVDFRIRKLAWGGLAVIVRVVIVWYLYQTPVRDVFEANVNK
jgi:hypothetical protein